MSYQVRLKRNEYFAIYKDDRMIFSYPSDRIVNIEECLLLDCEDMSHKFSDLLNFCLTINTNEKVFNIEHFYDNDIIKIKIKEQLDSIRGKLDIKLKHNETIVSIKSYNYPKLYYSNKKFFELFIRGENSLNDNIPIERKVKYYEYEYEDISSIINMLNEMTFQDMFLMYLSYFIQ